MEVFLYLQGCCSIDLSLEASTRPNLVLDLPTELWLWALLLQLTVPRELQTIAPEEPMGLWYLLVARVVS